MWSWMSSNNSDKKNNIAICHCKKNNDTGLQHQWMINFMMIVNTTQWCILLYKMSSSYSLLQQAFNRFISNEDKWQVRSLEVSFPIGHISLNAFIDSSIIL